jgi:excisionase family DNA binding protein
MRPSSSEEPTRRTPPDTRGTVVHAPEAPQRRSPSAWDEPLVEPSEGENAQPEPGALQEWYRYIDSLARPSRRLHDEEEQDALDAEEQAAGGEGGAGHAPTARPWSDAWSPPTRDKVVDPAAAQEIVEQLAATSPHAAPVEWSPSLPEVAVPELDEFIPPREVEKAEPAASREWVARLAPSVPTRGTPPDAPEAPVPSRPVLADAPTAIPRPGPPAAAPAPPAPRPASEMPADVTALVPVPGSDRAESPFGERRKAPTDLPRRDLPGIPEIREQWPRYAERLRGVPATEIAQNSYKTPFKESREELIGRLLDPPLTLEETARLIGVCPTTVRRYTNRGWLAHYRTPGNQRRFRLSAVLTFLEEHGETSLVEEE